MIYTGAVYVLIKNESKVVLSVLWEMTNSTPMKSVDLGHTILHSHTKNATHNYDKESNNEEERFGRHVNIRAVFTELTHSTPKLDWVNSFPRRAVGAKRPERA